MKLNELKAALTIVSLRGWPGPGKKKHSGIQTAYIDPIKNKVVIPARSKAKKFIKM